jgi:O-antigen/teichoic acid export membrane protein
VLRVLALIGILHSVFYVNGSVMLAMGKASWRLGIALLNAVCNIAAFAFAVRWGIVAVAGAYVIRGYVLSPVPIWALKRLVGINLRDYLRQYQTALIGVVGMALVITVVGHMTDTLDARLQLLTCIIGGGVAYLLTVRVSAPKLAGEIIELVRIALPGLIARKA